MTNDNNKSIIPIDAPEVAPQNIPFADSDDDLVASDGVSAAISNDPYESISEHLCLSKQLWKHKSGCLYWTDKFTCTWGNNQVQLILSGSPRSLQFRLVTLSLMPKNGPTNFDRSEFLKLLVKMRFIYWMLQNLPFRKKQNSANFCSYKTSNGRSFSLCTLKNLIY